MSNSCNQTPTLSNSAEIVENERPVHLTPLRWSKYRCHHMSRKCKNSDNSGNWIGIGTAIGAAVYAVTNEPVWIAVGVAIGAALGWRKPKNKN